MRQVHNRVDPFSNRGPFGPGFYLSASKFFHSSRSRVSECLPFQNWLRDMPL